MSDKDRPVPTPRYRRVLANSAETAGEMGHSYVGVEHLFLAIIRDRDAVPTQALAKLVDLDQVEAGLLEVMASSGYAGQAPAGAVWFPRSELRERLAALETSPGARYGFNVAGDQAWIIAGELPRGVHDQGAAAAEADRLGDGLDQAVAEDLQGGRVPRVVVQGQDRPGGQGELLAELTGQLAG
jgi:hypothetical protein